MARRTKEEALATRNRLLDAAELLFQAQGVSQTTLQQIAQQAGATRGAIYWHFKDKADLFNAMMERVILPLETTPRAAATAPNVEDPLAEIEDGMVHALNLMATDPQVRRVFDVATHKVEYTHDMASSISPSGSSLMPAAAAALGPASSGRMTRSIMALKRSALSLKCQ